MKFTVIAFALLSASAAMAGPRVSCTMRKQDIVVYDREKKTSTETERWTADCSISIEGKQIWSGTLPLPQDASFREAADAIDEFRSHKAREIIKGVKQ